MGWVVTRVTNAARSSSILVRFNIIDTFTAELIGVPLAERPSVGDGIWSGT